MSVIDTAGALFSGTNREIAVHFKCNDSWQSESEYDQRVGWSVHVNGNMQLTDRSSTAHYDSHREHEM